MRVLMARRVHASYSGISIIKRQLASTWVTSRVIGEIDTEYSPLVMSAKRRAKRKKTLPSVGVFPVRWECGDAGKLARIFLRGNHPSLLLSF